MAKTIEQIQEEVQQIKNETVAKQNTATRVGGALEDMVEKMEADSISVEGKLTNLGSKVGELSNSKADKKNTPTIKDAEVNSNLDISDESGNVILRLTEGDLATKNFNSKDTPAQIECDSSADFAISDRNGNVIIEFKKGHLRTKEFDSNRVNHMYDDNSDKSLCICDPNGFVLAEFNDGHLKTQKFDSSDVSKNRESKWKGKKIAFVGDSITYGVGCSAEGKYTTKLCSLLGAIELNYGQSGTHLAKFDSRVYAMDSSADLIIVFGGTNDFGHASTQNFGNFDDAINSDTFYGGMHKLFQSLRAKYPEKPIVVMTPLHHGIDIDEPEYECERDTEGNYIKVNGHRQLKDNVTTYHPNSKTQKTFREYVEAIKEVASCYSLIVLDAYSFSGLQPIEEKETRNYFKDGLHLQDKGALKLVRWMIPQLEAVYPLFYD